MQITLLSIHSALLFFALFVVFESPAPIQGQTFNPIRINCGGAAFTDSSRNQQWLDERPYVVGNKGQRVVRCTTVNITNVSSSTGPRDVYCSNHVFFTTVDVQPFQYQIPVPNTVSNSNYYAIRLHFAEIVRTLLHFTDCDYLFLYQSILCSCTLPAIVRVGRFYHLKISFILLRMRA
jgi:Malectin domain